MLPLEIRNYIEEHSDETYELLKTIARIPAPSNHEEKRAEFCRDLLQGWGAQGVCIDDALNVVFPYTDNGKEDLTVFMAHIDVVFPDMQELPLHEEGDHLCCPGVGDDTANLAAMLMVVKYLLNNPRRTKNGGVIFVCNAGEEGLGNLKGVRKICETYGKRITRFYSFDGQLDGIVNKAVGSCRYRVSADTIGGHSYGCFGNPNAIHGLSGVIRDIYDITVPGFGKTTYNVGTISGGTSVNTIAQHAEMLCEYRSDDVRGMDIMSRRFATIFNSHNNDRVTLDVELVGERPCGELDEEALKVQEEMTERAVEILHGLTDQEISLHSGSTDCNIPLSMNIPSLCYGFYMGDGAHTREEYVEISSLKTGYQAAFASILDYFEI